MDGGHPTPSLNPPVVVGVSFSWINCCFIGFTRNNGKKEEKANETLVLVSLYIFYILCYNVVFPLSVSVVHSVILCFMLTVAKLT